MCEVHPCIYSSINNDVRTKEDYRMLDDFYKALNRAEMDGLLTVVWSVSNRVGRSGLGGGSSDAGEVVLHRSVGAIGRMHQLALPMQQ